MILTKMSAFIFVITIIGFSNAAFGQSANVQTKQYENGGFYTGTFKNGRQHGYGTYSLPSGYQYEGEWENGQAVGEGVAKFSNSSVYTGTFLNGKPNGIGTIIYADGSRYTGVWVEAQIDGEGIA